MGNDAHLSESSVDTADECPDHDYDDNSDFRLTDGRSRKDIRDKNEGNRGWERQTRLRGSRQRKGWL